MAVSMHAAISSASRLQNKSVWRWKYGSESPPELLAGAYVALHGLGVIKECTQRSL